MAHANFPYSSQTLGYSKACNAAMAHGELTPQVIAHQCHQRSAKEHLRQKRLKRKRRMPAA